MLCCLNFNPQPARYKVVLLHVCTALSQVPPPCLKGLPMGAAGIDAR